MWRRYERGLNCVRLIRFSLRLSFPFWFDGWKPHQAFIRTASKIYDNILSGVVDVTNQVGAGRVVEKLLATANSSHETSLFLCVSMRRRNTASRWAMEARSGTGIGQAALAGGTPSANACSRLSRPFHSRPVACHLSVSSFCPPNRSEISTASNTLAHALARVACTLIPAAAASCPRLFSFKLM